MRILRELWNGNILLHESPFPADPAYQQTLTELNRLETSLLGQLHGQDLETFTVFQDQQGELLRLSMQESFVEGFRLGAQIILDVLE